MAITFKHSGGFGDIVYAMSILPKLPTGRFLVAMNNIVNITREYGYNPDTVHPYHRPRLLDEDFDNLRPLLERQSYIESVGKWRTGDPLPDVDLDLFRKIAWFDPSTSNFLEWYHKLVGLPFDPVADINTNWIQCDPKTIAPVVVSRTERYVTPAGYKTHKELYDKNNLKQNAIFIGTDEEHQAYETNVAPITRYIVKDYLDMANVIAGAKTFLGNQTFAYALAIGTGIQTVLETRKDLPLIRNECYFNRSNCTYF